MTHFTVLRSQLSPDYCIVINFSKLVGLVLQIDLRSLVSLGMLQKQKEIR